MGRRVKLLVMAGLGWMACVPAAWADLECTPTKACNIYENCELRYAEMSKPFQMRKDGNEHQFRWRVDDTLVDIEQHFPAENAQIGDEGAIFHWDNVERLHSVTLMLQKWNEKYFFTISMQRATEYGPVGEIATGSCTGTLK